MSIETNLIYRGDCYTVLRSQFPENCIDLIYVDPPFSFDPRYARVWLDPETARNFEELRQGGPNKYVEYMLRRIEQCYRVLKDTGSLYLHCDEKFGDYLKVRMDGIFGKGNFRNNVTWRREFPKGAKAISRQFPRDSDRLLFYTKGRTWTFNKQWIEQELTPEEAKRAGYRQDEGSGRWFKTAPRGDYTDESIARLRSEGRIYTTRSGTIRIVYWAETRDGRIIDRKLVDDIWTDLPGLMHVSETEKIGYATQKPEALLERIVRASSNPGDIVLDPMCGCGTTIVVAHKLGRQWIGIDISSKACGEMKKRMAGLEGITEVNVIGLPLTTSDLKSLGPFEFQDYVCDMTRSVKTTHVADEGIDGYHLGETPLQIKRQERVGRRVVDEFETALRRKGKNEGYIIAFSFTRGAKGAYEEAARAKDDGLAIHLVRVDKLILNDYELEALLE